MLYNLPNGSQTTYPPFVAALVKPGDAILATLTPDKADAWHMASCIPGEAGELFTPLRDHDIGGRKLDRENLIEELGDIEFYVEGLRRITDILYEETIPDDLVVLASDYTYLPQTAADVFDVVKKWVIYNKPLDRAALVHKLYLLETVLAAIREACGISRAEVLQANVTKLGVRYANLAYSDAAAQQRADKTIH
ncbi:hypothetical protein [Sphingobium sp. MK2]|uniref:hypothetical protein n=1 Tax=Sphingobium sp. MK2 TaxID=3116540 RepID=UPI0032E359D2